MNKNAFEKMKNILRQFLPQPVKALIKKARILTLRGSCLRWTPLSRPLLFEFKVYHSRLHVAHGYAASLSWRLPK